MNFKLVVLFVCTVGCQLLASFSAGDNTNRWLAAGAALLAGVASIMAVSDGNVSLGQGKKWASWLAGLSGAACVFALFQITILALSLGMASGLGAANVKLDSSELQAMMLGILSSAPLIVAPIALFVGSVTIFHSERPLVSTAYSVISFWFLAFLGQLLGLISGQTDHFSSIIGNGILETAVGFVALTLLFAFSMLTGAVVRRLFGFVNK